MIGGEKETDAKNPTVIIKPHPVNNSETNANF